jgi:hypothetical protein
MTDETTRLLDEALQTLDTYRGRPAKYRTAMASWRSSDAARIVAALPKVGLVLMTKDAFDRAVAGAAAARDGAGASEPPE